MSRKKINEEKENKRMKRRGKRKSIFARFFDFIKSLFGIGKSGLDDYGFENEEKENEEVSISKDDSSSSSSIEKAFDEAERQVISGDEKTESSSTSVPDIDNLEKESNENSNLEQPEK